MTFLLRVAGTQRQEDEFRAAIATLTAPLAEFDGNLRPHIPGRQNASIQPAPVGAGTASLQATRIRET